MVILLGKAEVTLLAVRYRLFGSIIFLNGLRIIAGCFGEQPVIIFGEVHDH